MDSVRMDRCYVILQPNSEADLPLMHVVPIALVAPGWWTCLRFSFTCRFQSRGRPFHEDGHPEWHTLHETDLLPMADWTFAAHITTVHSVREGAGIEPPEHLDLPAACGVRVRELRWSKN